MPDLARKQLVTKKIAKIDEILSKPVPKRSKLAVELLKAFEDSERADAIA